MLSNTLEYMGAIGRGFCTGKTALITDCARKRKTKNHLASTAAFSRDFL
jgi:hypothetical protein